MILKRGTQIAYVPNHAEGDISHPDVEYGFVTSSDGNYAFCRYWSKTNPDELRTKANSELTPISNLVVTHRVSDDIVSRLLESLP